MSFINSYSLFLVYLFSVQVSLALYFYHITSFRLWSKLYTED